MIGEKCQVAGSIEADEAAWKTALREFDKEIGLPYNALYSKNIFGQIYEADRDAISIAPVFVAFIDNSTRVSLNDDKLRIAEVSFIGHRQAQPRRGGMAYAGRC